MFTIYSATHVQNSQTTISSLDYFWIPNTIELKRSASVTKYEIDPSPRVDKYRLPIWVWAESSAIDNETTIDISPGIKFAMLPLENQLCHERKSKYDPVT